MKVNHVMTYDVDTCRPDTNLSTAAMQMWKGDFGILPVVLDGGKVVGIITDRDICMAAAIKRRDPGTIRVEEVISGQVYRMLARHRYPAGAQNHAERNQVRRLLIINADDRKLAGILSINDVALKAQADGEGRAKRAGCRRYTSSDLCASEASAPVTEPFQPVRQLAA